MSRPARNALPTSTRERLAQDFTRAVALRQLYPQLSEVRIEFDFQDGTTRPPSSQSFSCFPAARAFFRYACPCHSCNGEFDLTALVAELAGKGSKTPRTKSMSLTCPGQRAVVLNERTPCPVVASVRINTTQNKD